MLRTLLLYGFVARLSSLRLSVCIYYSNNDHPTLSIVSIPHCFRVALPASLQGVQWDRMIDRDE